MMFKNSEIHKPKYGIRMLLNHTCSPKTEEIPVLKPFSHFSLGCTYKDEPGIKEKFETLANYLKGPLSLTALEVVNLGTEIKPLWGVKLNFGEREQDFRSVFGSLFDDIMCHQMDGNLYVWNPKGNQRMYCPHITIGPNQEDHNKAQKLVESECIFNFERMDYKQVGPFEPHVIKDLAGKIDSIFAPNK